MLDYYRFKEVYELFLKGRTEEGKHLLMELQAKYIEVCDTNTALKAQVQEFEDILYLSKNLVFDGNFYWLITGNIRQGPFCQNCYNRDGLLVRLNDVGSTRKCYSCGSLFERDGGLAVGAASSISAASFEADDSVSPAIRTAKVIPLYK